jgi:hypothetical protein
MDAWGRITKDRAMVGFADALLAACDRVCRRHPATPPLRLERMMWTEAQGHAELVRDTVADPRARQLLYQVRVNLELFLHASAQLAEAFDDLDFHNFSITFGGCHMDEGIFGTVKHRAEMAAAKERVLAFLNATVTSGHRFIRALRAARKRDRGNDWGQLRMELERTERNFHDTRNFLEHLDEAIARGEIEAGSDASFSATRLLTCKDAGGEFTFDFSPDALAKLPDLYDEVVDLLKARQHGNM